jgi:hypothetical protein
MGKTQHLHLSPGKEAIDNLGFLKADHMGVDFPHHSGQMIETDTDGINIPGDKAQRHVIKAFPSNRGGKNQEVKI